MHSTAALLLATPSHLCEKGSPMADQEFLRRAIVQILQNSSVQTADIEEGSRDQVGCRLWYRATTAASPTQTDSPGADFSEGRYLIASLTKSVVSLLAVQLAAEGLYYLNEPVRNFLPSFRRGPLRTITLRHLLTHTSGLPDMLPDNDALRERHATISEFAQATAAIDPAFQPGHAVSYCSMGFAVLACVIEHVTAVPVSALLSERLLHPLQMHQSWLGLPDEQADELLPTTVPSILPPAQPAHCNWNWNSRYWRTLGAPWGGMISTVSDLGRLLQCLLRQGVSETGQSVLFPATVRSSSRNQTRHMAGLQETDRLRRPWGLGWRLNWPDHSGCFSDFLPASAWGHWGATGTLMWINPKTERWCVILTNQPFEQSQQVIQRISNVIAAAG